MTYRICYVTFSTNRINYLSKTLLSAQKMLNFDDCEVDKIFIDDYPDGRNNRLVTELVKCFGYTEIILHHENLGITRTWQEFFDLIKDREYDYILHQEDDVEIIHPVKVTDLIDILKSDTQLSQIQLKRNNWYPHETQEVGILESDVVYNQYRYEIHPDYFWMLTSLYPAWISREPIFSQTGYNPSESVIASYLRLKYNIGGALLKTQQGGIMVNHIGEYTVGTRVLPNEPGYAEFANLKPKKRYDSKTGQELA